MNGCSVTRVVPWQSKVIPGLYEYTHSWTYPSPEGNFTITCYEEGTLEFRSSGWFEDHAVQYHTANTPDQPMWTYDYESQGRWKVENDHFLFRDDPYYFVMDLMGVNINDYRGNLDWASRMSDRIVRHSTPSNRWVVFDIVTLNDHEFTWSYTYPDGHTDFWEMHRVAR